MSDKDLLAYALYPQVYADWKDYEKVYGKVKYLPTNLFLTPMQLGEEVEIFLGPGKSYNVRLVAIQEVDKDGNRLVSFELNGESWYISVTDHSAETDGSKREKAVGIGAVGSPMPGVIVGLKVKEGDMVKEGEAVASLSAMKMETTIPATASGIIKRICVNVGDNVEGDDLLMEIE